MESKSVIELVKSESKWCEACQHWHRPRPGNKAVPTCQCANNDGSFVCYCVAPISIPIPRTPDTIEFRSEKNGIAVLLFNGVIRTIDVRSIADKYVRRYSNPHDDIMSAIGAAFERLADDK